MEPPIPTPPSADQTPPATPVNPPPATQPVETVPLNSSTTANPTQAQPPPPAPPPKHLINKKLVMIGGGTLVVILAFVSLLLGLSGGKSSNNPPTNTANKRVLQKDKNKQAAKPKEASQTFVYGTWTSQQSVIRAVDMNTDQINTLVSLPLTVKKVSILSNKTLLYIDQIDSNEYGQRISIYDLQQKQIVTNIPAAAGMSIADYVLSPNKQYLALWEVSLGKDTNTLQGGQSSVYSVDLTRPTLVNPLYNEPITTTPVHTPQAVLNDGTVFTDTFFPTTSQTDPGYEHGLNVINFDGTNQRDITAAPAVSYGSKPVLSPDQKYLLFSGYDGANGDGNTLKNGSRQAVLTPNSIDILNTQSLQRFKLPRLPQGSVYAAPQWDAITGNPIITILASTTVQQGVYAYDLGKQTLTKLPFNPTGATYISQLPQDKLLIGTPSTEKANFGNLGLTDAYAFTQLSILPATASESATYLGVQDPFVQYITLLQGNYFPIFRSKKQ